MKVFIIGLLTLSSVSAFSSTGFAGDDCEKLIDVIIKKSVHVGYNKALLNQIRGEEPSVRNSSYEGIYKMEVDINTGVVELLKEDVKVKCQR